VSLDLKAKLNSVEWTADKQISTVLSRTSTRHGFLGVGAAKIPDAKCLKQIHGTQIHSTRTIEQHNLQTPLEGDGVWTTDSHKTCAIYTADCLPILISSKTKPWVAAVHAGWRGLTKGILKEALTLYDGASTDLAICIGPAISGPAFEVGDEVVEAMFSPTMGLSSNAASLTISKGLRDKWHVDLGLSAVLFLIEQGVPPTQLEVIQICTKQSAHDWHSYRREKVLKELNWAWIHVV
jgi:YfiH family protein